MDATFERWPEWMRNVRSMSAPSAVAPEAWTGSTLGIDATHVWHLEPSDGRTLVRTEESFHGVLARLFRRTIQRSLDRSLEDGLGALKTEVEAR